MTAKGRVTALAEPRIHPNATQQALGNQLTVNLVAVVVAHHGQGRARRT